MDGRCTEEICDSQRDEIGCEHAPGKGLEFYLMDTFVVILFFREENKDESEAENLKARGIGSMVLLIEDFVYDPCTRE
jgi:hypothetical protein